MANAPRDVDEILESYGQTWEDIDPSIDITKGPVAALVYATSLELSKTEAQAGYISTVYQLENAEDIDDDDMEALGNNYSLDPNVGELADATVTFYRESRPIAGETYIVYEGSLVGSEDGRYIFSVTEDTIMDGSSPDIYYNADERRYEINCKVEAVSIGDDFNLPPDAIDSFITDISNFDGVTNYEPADGGIDPIDKIQFRNLIWTNLQALDSDMAGRLLTQVYASNPGSITDVSLVSSSEFELFERQSLVGGRTAYDVYVITDTTTQELQTQTALGGELYLPLDQPPVQSVQYVTVDGQAAAFKFEPDTDPAVRNSPEAKDRITLTTALQPGQTIEIKYYSYKGIWDANEGFKRRAKPFGNDVLVRLAYGVPVFITARLTTTTTDDRDSVSSDVQDYTESYLRSPDSPSATRRRFVGILDPRHYQDSVINDVTGISTFTVTTFARLDNAVQDVAILEFDSKTEYPILAPGFIAE